MPHILMTNYQGNPNIGLFCYATDKYCLVPRAMDAKLKKEISEVLQVPVHEMAAAGTALLGVFFAGNEHCLLVPEIMFDSELEELKKLGINYHVVKGELTALGNNLIVGEKAAFANPDFTTSALEQIGKALKAEAKHAKIAGLNIVGSLAKGNKKGMLLSSEAKDFERKFLKDTFKVKVTAGTLNFGSAYVASGFIANSHGFVVGDNSGGPEIQNLDEALDFTQ